MKEMTLLTDLGKWLEDKSVGKYVVMRSHKGGVGVGIEQVVKLHELEDEVAQMIRELVAILGALRVNIICNVNTAEPDRIEIFKIRG